MSVRMRHTRAHTGNRRAHHALTSVTLSKCSNCGALRRPHTVCLACGTYRGRIVVDVAAKVAKRADKRKAKTRASA